MKSPHQNVAQIAAEWLHFEATGAHLRQAHRCVEWDGWEEGLVASIIGPEELEEEWIREAKAGAEAVWHGDSDEDDDAEPLSVDDILKPNGVRRRRRHATKEEKERERLLAATGDECGGRGGELGRRLEAVLSVHADEDGVVVRGANWDAEHDEKEYEAEAE